MAPSEAESRRRIAARSVGRAKNTPLSPDCKLHPNAGGRVATDLLIPVLDANDTKEFFLYHSIVVINLAG